MLSTSLVRVTAVDLIPANDATRESNYFFAGDVGGDAFGAVDADAFGAVDDDAAGAVDGEATGAAGRLTGAAGEGVGVAEGAVAGVDDNTEREPLRLCKPSASAISMNAAAAPIVIFANRLAVPRGPNAVLDNVFENKAPASALPGCSKTTTIRIRHERMNNP